MRLLFLGDVVGRRGREAVLEFLPRARRDLDPDLIVVNAENAAAGFGLTVRIAEEFLAAGVDVITTGNHVWDQRELVGQIDRMPRVLRPLNLPAGAPGRGAVMLTARGDRKVLVMNACARLFMEPIDDPFAAVDAVLAQNRMGAGGVAAALLDFHGEATSEKMIMGHHLDGRVSLVVGTHTHVPSADHQILPGGTAYMSDAGMCGDYDSAIGMKKDVASARFIRKLPTERLSPAEGPATVCGVLVETVDATGAARSVEPIRFGGRLSQTMPAKRTD